MPIRPRTNIYVCICMYFGSQNVIGSWYLCCEIECIGNRYMGIRYVS